MRLLVDECCERPLVELLRRGGHDVLYMLEHRPGLTDRKVVELARAEGRVLITDDKDFGELIIRQRLPSSGVVLLPIAPPNAERRGRALVNALSRFGDRLGHQFTVVRANVVRVRLLER